MSRRGTSEHVGKLSTMTTLHPGPGRGREGGSAVLLSLITITLLAVLIGLALNYTSQTAAIGSRARDLTGAQALAEGALEVAFKRWQDYMIQTGGSRMPSFDDLNSTVVKPGEIIANINAMPGRKDFNVTSLRVVPVDRADNEIRHSGPLTAADFDAMLSIIPVPNRTGWMGRAFTYRAQVAVTKNTARGGPISVTLSRYFQKSDSSLFQAMLFFQDDLELHPGPNMTLYGLVHTNSNLYAAAGSNGSLTFSSAVSYTGNKATVDAAANATVRRDGDGDATGYIEGVTQTLFDEEANWSNFKKPVYATSESAQLSQVAAMDPLGAAADQIVPPAQQNANTSGLLHEIIERPVPVSSTDPDANPSVPDPEAYSQHRMFNKAGLRILINRNDSKQKVRVYVPDSTDPSNSVEIIPTRKAPTAGNIADQIIATITPAPTTPKFFDFREGTNINVNTVDVSLLTPYLNSYGAYNGVVYISDITNATNSGDTAKNNAVRLKKGGVLPDNGMTVVSDGGLYIQGDYNTGTTYKADTASTGAVNINSQPAANTSGDPTKYTVAGYTQKPAAVIGDAVMILSNNWLDGNSSQQLSSRIASPTTFNAAIMSGQVLTTQNSASGGAHNFPRFLEDWGGKNFTYYGSMVELFASKRFTGLYGQSNVYSPPVRRWYFDNTFLATPPPGSLTTTSFTRGRWVRY